MKINKRCNACVARSGLQNRGLQVRVLPGLLEHQASHCVASPRPAFFAETMANSASGSVGSRARSPTVERHRVRCKVVRIVPRGVSSRGEAVISPRRTSGRGCLENQASVTTIVPRRYSLGPRKAARPEGARSRAPTVAKAKPERTRGRVNPTRSGTCSPSARMTVTAASANIETTRRRPVNRTPPLPRRRSAPLRRPAAPAPASAARAAITAPERLDVVEEGVYLARIDEAYAAEPTAERGTDKIGRAHV